MGGQAERVAQELNLDSYVGVAVGRLVHVEVAAREPLDAAAGVGSPATRRLDILDEHEVVGTRVMTVGAGRRAAAYREVASKFTAMTSAIRKRLTSGRPLTMRTSRRSGATKTRFETTPVSASTATISPPAHATNRVLEAGLHSPMDARTFMRTG